MKKFLSFSLAAVMICVFAMSPIIQVKAAEQNEAVVKSEAEDFVSEAEEQEPVENNESEVTEGENEGEEPEQEPEGSEEEKPESENKPELTYRVHVQSIGWQEECKEGEMAGTSGQSLRLEAMEIHLNNISEEQGTIEYTTHVQTYGWKDFVSNGEVSGTTGESKRLEAMKIRLTGQLAEEYDIYYRVHIQTYGWLDWACNGASAGSAGMGKRLEAMEIRLVKKGEDAPGSTDKPFMHYQVGYQTHSQYYGWQKQVYDDEVAGVVGEKKRLEAIKIVLPEQEYEGDIQYRVYLQTYGWQDWKKNGELAGLTGEGKRIEAIEIQLTGEMAEYYDVYYSVHMAKIGWCNYALNGETTGSMNLSKQIEAVKICLVKKGEEAPETEGRKFVEGYATQDFYYAGYIQDTGESGNVAQGEILGTVGQKKRLENIVLYLDRDSENKPEGSIRYATHLSGLGWQDEVEMGTISGSQDGSHGIEAIRISLSGDISRYYDVYYRTHVAKYGWLGWAKNGQDAGTTKNGYRMEAILIKLVSKDAAAPGSNSNYYTEKKYRRYQNPGQYYQIQDSITLSGGGYTLSYGYEGVKVMKVIQKLGLGSGIGMGGAIYGHDVENAVARFQRKNGLSETGNVDLLTWLRLGFDELQWEQWGAYVSPIRVNDESTRSDHIEAMIDTAYSYLGTPYVIGASGPVGTGVDCSGLVMQGLYAAGMDISPINPVRHAQPGYEYESRNMWASSQFMHVSYAERQRGDLIFYQNSSGVVIHVAIYLGNDQVIESWPNEVVVWPIKNGSRSNIKGVVRPFV